MRAANSRPAFLLSIALRGNIASLLCLGRESMAKTSGRWSCRLPPLQEKCSLGRVCGRQVGRKQKAVGLCRTPGQRLRAVINN